MFLISEFVNYPEIFTSSKSSLLEMILLQKIEQLQNLHND